MLKIATSAAALAVAVYWWWSRRQQREALNVDDCEAAFPTAQWVCAARAWDAELETPKIGSNIGGGPDTLARGLAGPEGEAIFQKGKALGHNTGIDLQDRSMKLDAHLMSALDGGVKQLVILAAGLDARAWRLPRMTKGVTVFEVDVPAALQHKASRLKVLGDPAPPCTRVVVEADLSTAGWPVKLASAGFDATERSAFLVEGLLMYLPPGAAEQLLRVVGTLMCPGSVLAGDSFINVVSIVDQAFVQSLGTKWTFDFRSHDALRARLTSAGLGVTAVDGIGPNGGRTPSEGDEEAAAGAARRMQAHVLSMRRWPQPIHALILNGIRKGDAGAKAFVSRCVDDRFNAQNLRDAPAAVRARVFELALSLPLEVEVHGTGDLLTALRAEADSIAESRAATPFYRRAYEVYAGVRLLMHMRSAGGVGGYVTYAARKE